MISHRALVVTRPRVLETRRLDPTTFSEGDEAVAEFGPGLLRLMSLETGLGVSIGEGGAFEWMLPAAAGGVAAYAVVDAGFEGMNTWTSVREDITWSRPCDLDETLIGTCRIAGLDRKARLVYRAFSRERGDLLAEGELLSVSIARDEAGFYTLEPRRSPYATIPARERPPREHSSHPAAPILDTDDGTSDSGGERDWRDLPVWTSPPSAVLSGEGPSEALFVLRPPRVMRRTASAGVPGAIWEWCFPRDLLNLLGNRIAGGSEPLGRRYHPYGRMDGMAVHAALAIGPARAVRSLRVERWQAPHGKHDFRIRSTLVSRTVDAAESVHDVYEGERPVGTVRVRTDAV